MSLSGSKTWQKIGFGKTEKKKFFTIESQI